MGTNVKCRNCGNLSKLFHTTIQSNDSVSNKVLICVR